MANLNQANGNGTLDSQVAWYRTIFYDAPLRDYAYRADTVRDAAYAPTAANRTMWARR